MKKILLVDPVYNPGTIPKNVPLSKLAAGLNACGIQVETAAFLRPDCEKEDFSYFRLVEQDFIKRVLDLADACDAVYITSGTGTELKPYPIFPRLRAIGKAIRAHCRAQIFVGGALMNLYLRVYGLSQEQIKGDCFDHIIIGNEYIEAMRALVSSSFPKSVVPLWSVWKENNYPPYQSIQYHSGCPYSCDFCFEGKIYDKASETTTLEDFLASVSQGKNTIIEDSVLLSNKDFYEMMGGLQSKKLQFAAYARISEIVKEPEKVETLKKSGCTAAIVGIETLDDSLLKEHNKNIVSAQTRLGLDILKDNGLAVQGCFMLGFPGDSIANMERTIQFAIDEKLNGYRWHIYQPNYSAMPSDFSLYGCSVSDHLHVQLNVPDHCLRGIMLEQPLLGRIDEHFMIRSKNYIPASAFEGIGYRDSFSYVDVKRMIDKMFPQDWILNEEELYAKLFRM